MDPDHSRALMCNQAPLVAPNPSSPRRHAAAVQVAGLQTLSKKRGLRAACIKFLCMRTWCTFIRAVRLVNIWTQAWSLETSVFLKSQ